MLHGHKLGDYEMGREVRMVPKDWEHPKSEDGRFIALFDGDFDTCAEDWDKEYAKWDAGNYPDYASEENKSLKYSEWSGERPEKCDYMPSFKKGTATHLMMYETTSEGTPLSPAFETPEELAAWLFENEASAFGNQTASYKGWLRIAKSGYACSAVLSSSNGLQSGVEAFSDT